MNRLWTGAGAVACCAALAAGGFAAEPRERERRGALELSCDTASGAGVDTSPPSSDDVVVGPLQLVAIRRYARYPRDHFRPTRRRDFSAKVPLALDGGAWVRIAVAPRSRARASLAYGPSARQVRRVRGGRPAIAFEACADAPRTFWSGGLKVAGPRCVRLRVTAGDTGATRTLRVAFGRRTCAHRARRAADA